MIYASYDHNMPTFEVFLSFFLLFHFLCLQKLYIHRHLWESFSLYTYIPIHDELFLYTHALKLFLFISTRSIYKLYSCSKISFSFFQHTLVVYTKISLYTLITHTQEFLFTPYLQTHKILSYIFSFTYEKLFSFLYIYRHDICSQRFFLFLIFVNIMIFVHFIFRTTFLNENSTRFWNFNKHYRQ